MANYLDTGIPALNDLLGGRGLKSQSVILIRGAPGTGKTTLALQIARDVVHQQPPHTLYFLAVEERPEVLLNQITQSYWKMAPPAYFSGRIKQLHVREFWDSHLRRMIPGELRPGTIPLDQTISAAFWKWVLEAEQAPYDQRRVFLVVDSLTALIDWAQMRFAPSTPRDKLVTLLEAVDLLRQEVRGLTVMFIVEEPHDADGLAAESYIADTVIRLWRDTLTRPMPITPDETVDWRQDLLFCQVLKGRGLPIQRRACCYEFVSNEGVKFFPTYAAQGLVSLFFENQPQLEVIKDLRTIDVPASYPEVVVQQFTRSGLQNMFAVRRHTELVPLRHPLMLSNVDAYWVDVLKKNDLLHPIDRSRIHLYSQALPEDAEEDWRIVEKLRHARSGSYMSGRDYLAVPQIANVSLLVYRKDLLRLIESRVPETWEDLEDICRRLRDRDRPHKLLLETQTYDTLLTTILELGWAHGAYWYTRGSDPRNLTIHFEDGTFDDFAAAMVRLHHLIHHARIVPPRSSVDPTTYARTDWVFARHWYSTWVDVLTRTNKEGRPFSELGDSAEFGVARLPISRKYRDAQSGKQPVHHSTWGEWYLVIQRGSENVELGIDLINNLMDARKVVERALSGAALPPVHEFYETYGDDICFGTDLTYNQVRTLFFPDARSRSAFDSYYEVSRVLAGPLQAILSNPLLGASEAEVSGRIHGLLLRAFQKIDRNFKR
jgi:KaiC/GvpD/RAD55 family RecA-like ATPase